ncbi:MAG: tRNA lysidine(34) synthetase TilS [Gammaproteobacteria bacterium]|nr:tRNA lysidine(34) synthetase TilS [Gammaproteobacteria bacterium]
MSGRMPGSTMNEQFTQEHLRTALSQLPETTTYWVAYSGGLDSHVLLHAMAAIRRTLLPAQLRVVHVNHGLHHDAPSWAAHCERVCKKLGLSLTKLEVDVKQRRGESPEAAARRVRYQAFSSVAAAGDVLLTGHHRDDQAETMLLHLLRGAGPHGLSAMPPCRPHGQGWLARPLLEFSRPALRRYAESMALDWEEDPTNYQDRFGRNFLRNEVMPLLRLRWPAVTTLLARAAAHQAEAARLVDFLADADLEHVRCSTSDGLRADLMRALSQERQRSLMRRWIQGLGLPMPTVAHLNRVLMDVVGAAPDRVPLVRWEGAEVRRYRDLIFAMRPLPTVSSATVLRWPAGETLSLPYGRLTAERRLGQGIREAAWTAGVTEVRFRHGGERCRPAGRHHSHSLKKLLQERGVPPWVRERLPLVYVGGELAAVADLWVCAPFAAGGAEPGWLITWQGCSAGVWDKAS